MSLRYILFTALLLVGSFSFGRDLPIKTIVIDAGHGGKDPGASGPGHTNEKDIALSVALKLGEYISKAFPEIKVVYTRKTDEFIELHERAEIANKNKADLFIAVHCNASPNAEVYGTSTYALGLHRTEANLEVAKRENSVILMEDDRAKNYDFDPNSAEGHIIMTMKQSAFLDQSLDLASKIENQFEDHARRKSLGVKQAGFYVLYKTTMPSLLSEIGFISNPDEEKFLNSAKGQDQIAESLFNAFKQYKAGVEIASGRNDTPTDTKTDATKGNGTTDVQPTTTTKTDDEYITLSGGKKIKKPTENIGGGGKIIEKPKPVVPQPQVTTPAKDTAVITTTVITDKKEEPKTIVVETHTEIKKDTAPAVAITTPVKTDPVKVEPVKPEPVKAEPVKAEPVKAEPVVKTEPVKTAPVVKTEPKPVTTTPVTPAPVKTTPAAAGYNFKIQLFALKAELKAADREKIIRLFKAISEEKIASNGMTRYYAGNTGSYSDAKKMLSTALGNGYAGAFIIGTKGGKRLSVDDLNALDSQ